MNIALFLATAARSLSERPAVSIGTKLCWTYGELGLRVSRLAAGLSAMGLRPGDRIGIAMANCPQYIEVLFAAWHGGFCAVPLNAKLHPREIAYALDHCAARLCFITDNLAETLADLPRQIDGLDRVISVEQPEYDALFRADPVPVRFVEDDAPAWLFYTSGTTGRPKGATLTHRSLKGMTLRYYADIDQVHEVDTMLHGAPLSHGGGLYAIPHVAKAAHHVIPESRGFDIDETIGLTHSFRNLTFFTVPTMLNRLVNHPRISTARVDSIKTIFYGGAPMYLEDLKRALTTIGPRLVGMYAQGEMPNTITFLSKRMHADHSHPRREERLSSVGMARTGVEMRIVGQDGRELPPGEIGEVVARSDVCMAGYWNNPDATAQTIRDGWLFTGDVGCVSDDGFLTLKDRSKDLIISGGSNIYPREIEEVLMMDPNLLEVSVVGKPHAEWGEEVVAFVVPRPGRDVDTSALDKLCLDNIARFKRPKKYIMLKELPKSDYGKILKTELRKLLSTSS